MMSDFEALGETLRLARESRGKTVADLSDEMGLPEPYLQALEKGDMASLPGLTYARIYFINYARTLGLDDGQPVRVTTAAGNEVGELQVSDQIRRGSVMIPHGFGLIYEGKTYGINVNRLTKNTNRDPIGTPLHRFVPCRIEAT